MDVLPDLQVQRWSDIPIGTQLADRLRALIDDGTLGPGDRLPSLRDVAAQAGVNVNTVRSVYARLEADGRVLTQHGRGTFVAAAETLTRAELRDEIARLEGELARRPRPDADAPAAAQPPAARASLLSTEQLARIRDELLASLRELDAARADVIRRLQRLDRGETPAVTGASPRASSPSRAGARIRWVGA